MEVEALVEVDSRVAEEVVDGKRIILLPYFLDIIDTLKEFTRSFSGLATWLSTLVYTFMFFGIELPVLITYKKDPKINPLPIIITAVVGVIFTIIAKLSFPYAILGFISGGAIGYWADRIAARNIGKNISWLTNKGFKNRFFKKSEPSRTTSAYQSSKSVSAPSNIHNGDFGGGNFSGGGGSKKW